MIPLAPPTSTMVGIYWDGWQKNFNVGVYAGDNLSFFSTKEGDVKETKVDINDADEESYNGMVHLPVRYDNEMLFKLRYSMDGKFWYSDEEAAELKWLFPVNVKRNMSGEVVPYTVYVGLFYGDNKTVPIDTCAAKVTIYPQKVAVPTENSPVYQGYSQVMVAKGDHYWLFADKSQTDVTIDASGNAVATVACEHKDVVAAVLKDKWNYTWKLDDSNVLGPDDQKIDVQLRVNQLDITVTDQTIDKGANVALTQEGKVTNGPSDSNADPVIREVVVKNGEKVIAEKDDSFKDLPAGTYDIVVVENNEDNPNYNCVTHDAKLTVKPVNTKVVYGEGETDTTPCNIVGGGFVGADWGWSGDESYDGDFYLSNLSVNVYDRVDIEYGNAAVLSDVDWDAFKQALENYENASIDPDLVPAEWVDLELVVSGLETDDAKFAYGEYVTVFVPYDRAEVDRGL